jgi:hypothetical protein
MLNDFYISNLVEDVAHLDKQTFDNFMSIVYSKRSNQKNQSLSVEETELLKKINTPFSQVKWERLDFLDTKSENSLLSEAEQVELTTLTDAYEAYSFRKIKFLGQLADFRKTTLREVMHQLGIKHNHD